MFPFWIIFFAEKTRENSILVSKMNFEPGDFSNIILYDSLAIKCMFFISDSPKLL